MPPDPPVAPEPTAADDLDDLLKAADEPFVESDPSEDPAFIGEEMDWQPEQWVDADSVGAGWSNFPESEHHVLGGAGGVSVVADAAAAGKVITDLAETEALLNLLNASTLHQSAPIPAQDAFDLFSDDGADILVPGGSIDPDQFADIYEAWTDDYTQVPEHTKALAEAFKNWVTAKNDPSLSLTEKFDALKEYGETSRAIFDQAGLDTKSDEWKVVIAECKTWLTDLTASDRLLLAHHAGFIHPLLASGTKPGDEKASIIYWLTPAYEQDHPSKDKVQASQLKKYASLVDGTYPDIDGVTLEDVDADDALHAAPKAPDAAQAPGAVIDQAAFADLQALHAIATAAITTHDIVEKRNAALRLRWALHDPVLGEGVTPESVAALAPPAYLLTHIGAPQVPVISEMAGMDGDLLYHVGQSDLNKVADPSTPADTIAEIVLKADANKKLVAAGKAKWAESEQLWDDAVASKALTPSEWDTIVAGWKHGKQVATQLSDSMYSAAPGAIAIVKPPSEQDLRAGLKKVGIPDLRVVAEHTGMEHTGAPTPRSALQNWLIAQAHGNTAKMVAAQKAASDKHAAPVVPSPAPVAAPLATGPASKVPKAAKPAVSSASAAGAKVVVASWAKGFDDLSALLDHATKTHTDIPARDDAYVATMTLTSAPQNAPSGGSHTRVGFVCGQGQAWFGKPHPSSGGRARAITESTASEAKAALGLSAIPVYYRQVGTAHHAMQPLLQGAKPLSHNHKDLSQHDVDTIVRQTVGDWLVGEHDGKEDNWLRTASGGLTRCDLGQAFKFWGSDKPALDWEGNGNHGTKLIKQLLQADVNGGLAPGVRIDPTAALGVIGKAEAISDAEWAAIVRPAAEAGVKAGDDIKWVDRMRKKAAKRLGVADFQVTDDQVVDEFINEANKRRKSVREDMAAAFEAKGYDASVLRAL
ncbi:hypothetical protein DVS28_b0538 (plasmid) [Euzebya pacifica]|uniref:Uncharacterized protein n=1 Tax=Euzebya pacifica TaxID=1608957 RepID=A0A346Y731_9ACTN|nr:hypothetical protein DVS28_b0538 [Euzebya pacifica]